MERGHAVQWRLESDVFYVFADFAQRSESVHGECFVAGGVNLEVLLVRPNSTCEAEEVLLPRAGDKRRMAVSMVILGTSARQREADWHHISDLHVDCAVLW